MIGRGLKVRLSQFRGPVGSLRRHLVQGGGGSVGVKAANAGVGLVLSVVLARSLGPDGYGAYSLAYAVVLLLSIPAQLGLPTLLTREVAAYDAHGAWGLLRGILARAMQGVIAASVGMVVLGLALVALFSGRMGPLVVTMGLALLLLPLIGVGNLFGAALRALRRVILGQLPELLLRPGLLLLGVLTTFHFFPASRTPNGAMGLHLLAALLATLTGALLLGRALPDQVRAVRPAYDMARWVRSALPLSLLAGAGALTNQTDIVVLGIFRTPEEVGVYKVAVQGALLVAFGLQAINLVLAPLFAQLFAKGDMERLQRLATRSARVILLSALPVATVFIIWGGSLIALIFGEPFRGGHTSLAILALGQLFNAAMGSVGYLLNMTGHERDTAKAFGLSALLNLLLNLALVPRLGMIGAAFATAVSLAVLNLILYRAVVWRLGIKSTAFAV